MAPNLTGPATGLLLAGAEIVPAKEKQTLRPTTQPVAKQPEPQYQWKIVWRNVLAFIYLNTSSLYAIYLLFTVANIYTFYWGFFVAVLGGMGVTAGAHRLWAHRSYKAKWPLRLLLALFQCIAFQNHLYEWVRDHRVHHKFTDTDADPHNANRGFFFSHMGWLCIKKHPDVIRKGKTVDLSDLDKDWVVRFQRRFYPLLMPLLCFVFPMSIPMRYWGESFWNSFYIASILRYNITLHGTWLVNSAAHIWGMKPYDRFISASENFTVACLAFGEGWHNYHHAFPWDYKTSEFHQYRSNFSTAFIDFFAKIGWAYDLKTVPPELVARKAARSGELGKRDHDGDVWGWGDKDMPEEDMKLVEDYLKSKNKDS